MELIKTQNAKCDKKWIAQRLGITEDEAMLAIKTLEKLGLIQLKGNEKATVVRDPMALPSEIKRGITNQYHQRMIELAKKSHLNQDLSERNITSSTLRFSLKDLDKVDEMIRRFHREFSNEFENKYEKDEDYDSVYALNVQFFRLDQ